MKVVHVMKRLPKECTVKIYSGEELLYKGKNKDINSAALLDSKVKEIEPKRSTLKIFISEK